MSELKKVSGYVDLHVHTTCSDGTYTPEEVVKLAAKEGIKVLAITDHDNVAGISRAQKIAVEHGIKIIPGIECTTTFDTPQKGTRHILGYNIDPENEEIKKYVERRQNDRIEKVENMIKKLRAMGMYISLDDVKKFSKKGSIGRPHIARALVEKGYVNDKAEAFDRYIGKGKPAYCASKYISVEEVIFTIIAAGGIPILAHPFQMKYPDFETTALEIEKLINRGIEGIEAVYSEHSKEENYKLARFALDNGLYVTAGSDYHGDNKSIKLGRCFFNEAKISVDGLKRIGKTFF